jgi:hypothetical protein
MRIVRNKDILKVLNDVMSPPANSAKSRPRSNVNTNGVCVKFNFFSRILNVFVFFLTANDFKTDFFPLHNAHSIIRFIYLLLNTYT